VSEEVVTVQRSDVESIARKLEQFIHGLEPKEKEVMAWLMTRAGFAPSLIPRGFHYKPRGAQHLVIGARTGYSSLFRARVIHVTPPTGPLPDLVGVSIIPPAA